MNRKLVLPDDWKAYFLKFLQARKRTGQFPAYPPHLDLELSESNVLYLRLVQLEFSDHLRRRVHRSGGTALAHAAL